MSKIIGIGIAKKNNQKLKIEKVNNVEVIAGKGIKGDRNYHDCNEPRKQITLIESENIDYYNKKFNTNFSYLAFRRNLITKSIQLNDLVGKKLSIGQINVQVKIRTSQFYQKQWFFPKQMKKFQKFLNYATNIRFQ